MKYILVILFLGLGIFSNAQEVERDGKKYTVKKDKIFHNGNDVTSTFSIEEQAKIKAEFSKLTDDIKLKKKEEKRLIKAEKEQKKAEKAQKKAEKELKQKEKAQSNYNKAVKDLEQANKKYERLKAKGKLSPKDESKLLEKIQKLNEKIEKTQKKLKRS